jgi:hypothetical protein
VRAVGAGGHVAVGERVGEVAGRAGELAGQVGGQAEFGGAVQGARVASDQAADQRAGPPGVAKVAGAVERVESGAAGGDGRGVADVVQPRRRDQDIGVMGQGWGGCLGFGREAQGVGPAARELIMEQAAGQCLGRGLSWPDGTSQDGDAAPARHSAWQTSSTG